MPRGSALAKVPLGLHVPLKCPFKESGNVDFEGTSVNPFYGSRHQIGNPRLKNPIFIPKNRKLVKEQRVVREGKHGKPLVQQTIGSFSLRSATREDKLIPQICLGAGR